jgi:hypothetical protein
MIAVTLLVAIAGSQAGCSLGPRNFRNISHPAPMVRARAISLDFGQPDAAVLPSLVGRLDDPDVVVRLAAHEELKRRTGRDLGYVPWASPEERSVGLSRWHAWLTGKAANMAPAPPQPRKSLPRPSPQKAS